ncbi:MAG: glycosyltransferase family 4 protein [Nitrospira sp.]|nr:glycosyltransferase family 4 protein [Nitrospira sp.]
MKILFIHDDATEPGGANIYRKQLSRLLRNSGIEVFLFTFNAGHDEDSEHCCKYEYNKSSLKFLRYISNGYVHPGVFFCLRNWIRKVKPDIIHINHNFIFSNTVLLACHGERIPIIHTVHDHRIICLSGKGFRPDGSPCERIASIQCYLGDCIPLRDYIKDFIPRLLKKFLHKKTVSAFLIPSIHLNEKIVPYKVYSIFFPHFIDTLVYKNNPQDPNTNNILFAGRLHKGKGLTVLLHAFNKVLKDIPGVTLHIAGEGPDEQYFKNLANELQLDEHITFHGLIPHDQMHRYYDQSNVVVLPSVWVENSPLIILEAMASGRPVVCSRVGGIPEIIKDGENGLLCTPGDPEDLCNKTTAVLKDKEKAEEMGGKGREFVNKNYTTDRYLTDYFRIISQLTGIDRFKSKIFYNNSKTWNT